MFKYRDKQQLLNIYIYSMIAAYILEYMFITVTCCDETAKKLFGVCVRITMSTSLPGKLQDFLL